MYLIRECGFKIIFIVKHKGSFWVDMQLLIISIIKDAAFPIVNALLSKQRFTEKHDDKRT